MGLFDPQTPSGPFSCPDGTQAAITFMSSTRTITDAGEVVLTYADTVTLTGELQPLGGSYPRYVAGIVEKIDYEFIVPGNASVTVGNRTTISGARLEVVNVDHWGTEQTEILLKELGR